MAITAALVKELRERTGLGMMDCKKALQETDGDLDLAIENLRKSSALKAAKKAGRTAADGLLGLKVSDDGKRAAMVEINIETDFAAKNEKFIAFVGKVTDLVFERGSEDLASYDLDAERETLVQEIGENITLRRAAVVESCGGEIAHYIHTTQRQAALVEITGGDAELGKDLAMHVTAINPMVVRQAEVPADVVGKEREIAAAQAAESGKPAEIVEKMVEGKVRKFLAEVSLLDQPFVKDGNMKVQQLLKDKGADVTRFVRFEVGEGIDKGEEDFAAEVAAQLKS
ncbi:MAG: translation elongation factor Ts [Pseudomonadota bacterium]